MRAMMTRLSGRKLVAGLVLLLAMSVGACDKIDPTDVNNPQTTDEDLAQSEDPLAALIPGLRAQFARAIGTTVTTTAVVSDNYSVHGTGIQQTMDEPRTITPDLVNSTGTGSAHAIYWHLQELRALADFVLDEVAPGVDNPPADLIAEASYYRGMAFLMQSENFSAVPTEENGVPVPAAELRSRAIAELSNATSGAGDIGLAAQAALARAYRWEGDPTSAENAAQAVLSADPEFVFDIAYDAASITNNPWAFLVIRALQEMQPLPRLDFLDPKYLTRESPIAVAKAEEMHLILAEIDLAAGNMGPGQAHLADAIELAQSRGTTLFLDEDPRANFDLTIRPRDPEILIRADANSPFRQGLVLDRPGFEIPVPTLSNTSLDADSVEALVNADDIWHAYHLARQEILLLEGRRVADLGIRLPIMRREIESNPNISTGDPGTEVMVPGYIPTGFGMDTYTPFGDLYSGDLFSDEQILQSTEVTIDADMNKVLVDNNRTPF